MSSPAPPQTTLITVGEARDLVLEAVHPLPCEEVELGEALGRVLATEIRAIADVPPFASSAMDGYAVVAGEAGRTLTVTGESRAGAPAAPAIALAAGEAIRISTGAAIPPGATAVIPQELVCAPSAGGAGARRAAAPAAGGGARRAATRAAGDRTIRTEAAVTPGENIRLAGEDIRAHTTVLMAGTRLGAVELGAAAAAGAGSLLAARRPRVAVLCTGDELRSPGEPLGPGEIHNSNAPMLTALATRAGALAAPAERLPDDRAATEAGIATALAHSDVVVISGGVSVGPHDHVKSALAALGVNEIFWSVALQPGKPTWFGAPSEMTPLVFGLPGNPVSAVVTFSLFVAPALAALQGAEPPRPPCDEAVLAEAVARNPRRLRAVRVSLTHGPHGTTAHSTGSQESHILTSLIGADALAMIPQGQGQLDAGTTVTLQALCD
ncbi:MAG: gephyrin-like molybdotransferase Glp [Solirubrobacteraceae bacterium]